MYSSILLAHRAMYVYYDIHLLEATTRTQSNLQMPHINIENIYDITE